MMNDRRPQLVLVLFAAWVALSLGAASPGVAQPTMTIVSSQFVHDYDQNHPGLECTYRYWVKNASEPGDINNMIAFTIPAGSNQGVYAASRPSGWVYEIGPDSTHFQGNGGFIAPGISRTFALFSTLLHVGQGEATAVAVGTLGNPDIPFNSVLVPVPAHHPLDRDHDVDIDGDDLVAFEACVSGPAIGFTGDCGWADLDADTDVDQSDFGIFQRCLTGDGGGYIEGCEAE